MSNHFIFDFETLGQSTRTCPVINCAYYIFDWDRFLSNDPYTFNELVSDIRCDKLDVSVQTSREFMYKVEKNTVDFWMSLPKDVRSQALPSDVDIHPKEFVSNIINYVNGNKIQRWWSRSNTFDPIILWRLAEDVEKVKELNTVLPYYKVRDVRTFIDAKFDLKIYKNSFCPIDNEDEWNSMFKEHVSIHDIAADILRMQKIVRAEEGLL